MNISKTLKRQARIGLRLQLELSALHAKIESVADVLFRTVPALTLRPTCAADVPDLIEDLFPRRPRPASLWATVPDYRDDIVGDLLHELRRLIAGRWVLLSADRGVMLRARPWWRGVISTEGDEAAAYAIEGRIRYGRVSLEDACTISEAAAAIIKIGREVIAMHYEAACDRSRYKATDLPTWQPWIAPEMLRAADSFHEI